LFIFVFVYFVYFLSQKFPFQTHTVRKIGASRGNAFDLWRRFLQRVPWALRTRFM